MKQSANHQSREREDDNVYAVLQGMISTAQEDPYLNGKRRGDLLEMHTRSGRRVQSSSNKRFKVEQVDNALNPVNLLSYNLPSEDEDDEDYDMPAKSPPIIPGNNILQQYQSFDAISDNNKPPSEPNKRGRKRTEGTDEEKRVRRLEQQRAAAARARKSKKEELNKIEKDNEQLRYEAKVANDRITSLEKELREAKLHIYKLENDRLAVKGQNGQRHPAVKNLIEAVQSLVKATDGDDYEVLDKVDQEEAALTDDDDNDNDSN